MTIRCFPPLAVALGLLLSACSGSEDDAGDGAAAAQKAVVASVETAFMSDDPAHCTEVNTPEGLQQRVLEDEDPVATCEERTQDREPATSVTVEDVSVDGTTATAVARPDDGSNAGLQYSLTLVDDGGWKIDEITGVELVDAEAFEQVLGNLDDLVEDLPADDARCISAGARDGLEDRIEQYAINGDLEIIAAPLRDCLGDGDETAAVASITRSALLEEGYDEATSQCVAEAASEELADVAPIELLTQEEDAVRTWQETLVAVAPRCG